MRLPRLALTASLLVTSGLIGVATGTADAQGACEAFEVYTPKHGSASTLVKLSLPSGGGTELRKFGVELNAIGYSASQNLLYGMSSGSRVVTLDRGGNAVDRGKVHGVRNATAGAISGSTLYLRDGMQLVSLDVSPASPTYLKVVKTKWMSWLADVDDWDFGSDAQLYGVTTFGAVVSVNPVNGKVRTIGKPHGLPWGTYGAVLMAPGRVLYAINNREKGKSRLYRIPLAAPKTFTEVASYAPADTTDAAGCLTAPPVVDPPAPPPPVPPIPQPPVPPPATSRPAPPRTTPPRTTTPTTPPPINQVVQPPPPSPAPPPPSKARKTPPPTPKPVAARPKPDTEKKRRWAVTTIVLILGAGAAAGIAARHRH
ncbi:DUF6923 family protein [Kibdelosporangium phytohabitans]|uniref:DUF6923 domain-containing protein n=1 Tax=Kibdelosporangium phytohabitans TaxID=860235 RepID=A0A0N7F393_9PSEU|nr:hypothetical protein [Kibdelosporangium phytohabitans]ALG07991.1 hypothetical protein AOZ06_14650 [Kibdelosporangium phytohabitans]MBE1471057.1 hypothetical protein [Kibdelosporangium phytohabitans]